MADTYDDEKFIPLGIAFEQALSALEDCETLLKDPRLLPPYTATTEWPPASDPERNDLLNKYDDIVRRVERLLRDAIADRHLPLFKKAQNDQMERIVDQEEWRRLSFGIPGIENVPHHLTNPGGDTNGQPVFLKIGDFEDWLANQTGDQAPRRSGLKKLKAPILKSGPRKAARLALDSLYPTGVPIDQTGQELLNAVNKYIKKQPSDLIEGRVKQEVSLDTVLRAAERK